MLLGITSCFLMAWFERVNSEGANLTFEEKQKWLEKIIPNNYDNSLSPLIPLNLPGSFNITFTFYAFGITDINVAKMEFEVDIGVGLIWHDGRFVTNHRPRDTEQTVFRLPQKVVANIWTPSAFFSNQKQTGKTFLVGSGSEQLSLDVAWNTVVFWQRQLIKFRCYYALNKYPFDSHTCTIIFRADGRGDRDTKKMLVAYLKSPYGDCLPMVKSRMPPEYQFTDMQVVEKDCGDDLAGTPNSCLSIHFHFSRITSHHVMLTYIPSILIVLLSWLSFWFDVDCTAPRISLGLTSMLTLATQFGNAQKNLPAVAYVKAIDVWMITCVFMVFATLLEYSFAYQVHKQRLKWSGTINIEPVKQMIKKLRFPNRGEANAINVMPCRQSDPNTEEKFPEEIKVAKNKGNPVDKTARIVFPVMFACFNALYWFVCVAQ